MSRNLSAHLPALPLLLARVSLTGDSDVLHGLDPHPTVPSTTQPVGFASPPSLQLNPPPPSRPGLLKGLCVVPPARTEVGSTNYPFIPVTVPSALHSDPCSLPFTLSKFRAENKNCILFFPVKHSPPALTLAPIPFSALPWCPFLQENILSGRDQRLGRITQEPASIQTAAQPARKSLFSSLPSHANHPAVIRAAA